MHFKKESLNLRLYQQTILNTALNHNTLVVIPTGLGKTYIAIALAGMRARLGKVLFLAPTKPLVEQQKTVFMDFFEPIDNLTLLTGETSPSERKRIWEDAKIIFSTPQTIRNDVLSRRISLENVSLIIFDEAHRAIGEYAYVPIAQKYNDIAKTPKILALTASPGSDRAHINEIKSNLFIEKTELRDKDHEEVKEFTQETDTIYKWVTITKDLNEIIKALDAAASRRINDLYDMKFLNTKRPSKTYLLSLQKSFFKHKTKNYFRMQGVSLIAQVIKILHAKTLAESETVSALNEYLKNIWDQSNLTKNRGIKSIVNDGEIIRAYALTKKLIDNNLEHPKIQALQETIKDITTQNKNAKILVFTEYRANIRPILDKLIDSNLDVEKFVGQGHGQEKGMNQKEQSRVIDRFRNNELHALVATSVAEEGLDIPSVDAVIFYSPIPSGLRTIQRRGRTGRHSKGKLIILMTKGTKDVTYNFISRRKENAMKTILDPRNKTLKDFVQW